MTGVLSQDEVFEPLSVEYSPLVAECEPIRLNFIGGLSPYDIYRAVGHAADNNSTWSEEVFFSTVDDHYTMMTTRDIGV
jgi:hypothetical protein